jgi:hypothetical protein
MFYMLYFVNRRKACDNSKEYRKHYIEFHN